MRVGKKKADARKGAVETSNLKPSTWWTTKVSFPSDSEGNVTKFVPHKAIKLIASGPVDF